MARIKLPTKDYIISRTIPNLISGCWIWKNDNSLGNHGYIMLGRIEEKNRSYLAHQAVYEIWTGNEPPKQGSGYEIHHKCENKKCCNPDHLEIRTISSHRLEHGNKYTDVTSCIHGHLFSVENTYINPTSKSRQCKVCIKERAKNYYKKNKHKWITYKLRSVTNINRMPEI